MIAAEPEGGRLLPVPCGAQGAARSAPSPADGHASVLAALHDVGLADIASRHAAHAGLVCHAVAARGPFAWVQHASVRSRFGVPLLHGPAVASQTLRVDANSVRGTLWAMEEAVKAGFNVIGEIEGASRELDFTATRRLELFAREAGVTCLLIRLGSAAAAEGPSVARWRWRVSSLASALDPYDVRAPGARRWCLELVRARTRPPGRWIVEASGNGRDPNAPHRLRVVSTLAAGDVGARSSQGAAGGGNVVPLRRRAVA